MKLLKLVMPLMLVGFIGAGMADVEENKIKTIPSRTKHYRACKPMVKNTAKNGKFSLMNKV